MTDAKKARPNPGRRRLMQLCAAAPALALAVPHRAAAVDAVMSKAEVGYRDVPENGKVCAQCVYFIFGPATAAGPGSHCQLVAGIINPAGWCEVWAPKQ
jgi:hypothetical protein